MSEPIQNRELLWQAILNMFEHDYSAARGKMAVRELSDAVEFHRDPAGIPLQSREGLWHPYPVEYKRGKPKGDSVDELQLCAQAMCLEEMLCCTVPEGALYYGEPRRRTVVLFTPELRQQVWDNLTEMHQLYQQNIIIFSYSGASPALMGACAERQIGFAFCTPQGKFLARVCGEGNGNVLFRRTQYRTADDPVQCCQISRTI